MKKFLSIILTAVMLLSIIPVISINTVAAGDSFSSASAISVNKSYTDNISDEYNIDYYKFILSSAGSIYLNFKHENLFDQNEYWAAVIYDSATNRIAAYSFSGSETDIETYSIGLDAGTYYLKIYGGDWCSSWYGDYSQCYSTTDYSFIIKYEGSEYWEKENNESFSSASKINTNKTYSGSINDENDIDYYKFALSKNGYVYLNFSHENLYNQDEYWVAVIYDSATNVISAYSFSGSETDTYSVGLETGTYYLKIHGGNWYNDYSHCFSNVTYEINLKYKESSNWEKENNEGFSAANKIYAEKTYYGSINDKYDIDFYKFTLSRKTKVKISFNIKIQDSDSEYYQIKLYDSKSNQLLVQSIYGNKKTTYTYTVLPAGTYYLEVSGGDWWYGYGYSGCFTTETYSFKIGEVIPEVKNIKASQTSKTITLKWDKVSGATGYAVYKYSSSKKEYVKVGTTKSTSYKISKLSPGKTCKFIIKAYKEKSTGTAYSNAANFTTCTKPAQAKINSVSGYVKKSVLKWSKVSGASGYHIVYSTSKSFSNKKSITVSGSSSTSKTISSLKSGRTYYYKVRAYKKINGVKIYGAYSSPKSVKIK